MQKKESYIDRRIREGKIAKASIEKRFPLAKRREMFIQIANAQGAAEDQAFKRFPRRVDRVGLEDVDYTTKRFEYRDTLREKAESRLEKQFKLSHNEFVALKVEGMERQWPIPPFRQR